MGSRRSEWPPASSPAAVVMQRELRRRLQLLLYDESGVTPAGAAIYSLADPREARVSRYVGQTAQPARVGYDVDGGDPARGADRERLAEGVGRGAQGDRR